MAKPSILICGSGIAGPVLAYWLVQSKQDVSITIMERSPVPRTTGQAIDIRGAGVDIIRKMGLEETVRSRHTTEKGLYFVDSNGKAKGTFPATGSTDVQGFTSEFEIQRSDLSKIFLDIVQDKVTFVYDEYVVAIEQAEDGSGKIRVEYANGRAADSFDLVVGADGLTSRTRRLVFGADPSGADWMRQLGQFSALFTIPQLETADGWGRWYNMTRGRLILMRPDNRGMTAVYMSVTQNDLSRFDEAGDVGIDELKKLLRREFEKSGWVVDQVLDGMDQASDFYHLKIAQVKLPEFVRGRVALLGDAAYCPSPITGMGTSAALIGAYVLAGELSESLNDIPAALQRYQSIMKPRIDEFQKLFPGAPQLANPQTQAGISFMNIVVRILSTSFFQKFVFSALLPNAAKDAWKPPVYSSLGVS